MEQNGLDTEFMKCRLNGTTNLQNVMGFVLVFVDFAILDTKYKQKMDFVLHNHPRRDGCATGAIVNCVKTLDKVKAR